MAGKVTDQLLHISRILTQVVPDLSLTLEQLAAYDGKTNPAPIYLAIKGVIFDVTRGMLLRWPTMAVRASSHLHPHGPAERALAQQSIPAHPHNPLFPLLRQGVSSMALTGLTPLGAGNVHGRWQSSQQRLMVRTLALAVPRWKLADASDLVNLWIAEGEGSRPLPLSQPPFIN